MTSASNSDRLLAYYAALRETYRRDFPRFCAEQLKIQTATPGEVINLKFNPIQALLWKRIAEQLKESGYVRVVVVKPRQPGMSTFSQACMFHNAIFNRNFSSLLIAQDDDTTSAIFRKAHFFYDNLSPQLKPMIRYSSKHELVYENPDPKTRPKHPGLGSVMNFQSATRIQVGTGTTRHGVHLSEGAKFKPDACKYIEASLMPSIHLLPGTWFINEGTTFVEGDWFRAWCDKARSGQSEFIMAFFPWYMHPEYRLPLKKGERLEPTKDERYIVDLAARGQPEDSVPPMSITHEQLKWRRLMISARTEDGEAIFSQEYPLDYESSWVNFDVQVFPRDKMYEMRRMLTHPARCVSVLGGKVLTDSSQRFSAGENYIAVWKEPEAGRRYDIGVDTSIGIEGGDWTVAEVFDRVSHEQVAELHMLIDGLDLAEVLYALGHFYHGAQISVEMAQTGFTTNSGLQRLGYSNLYIWRHRERAFPVLSTYSGWKTQRDSKAYLVGLFKHFVAHGTITIRSMVLWNEMFDFIKIPGYTEYTDQFRAGRGHDDAVMATGIALVAGDDESMGMLRQSETGPVESRKEQIQRALQENATWLRDGQAGATQRIDPIERLAVDLRGWD